MRKKIGIVLIIVLSIALLVFIKGRDKKSEINISVASSLVEPINEIVKEYEKETNIKININSGGSGTLKKQITEGADVGVFFSANESYINELINEGLVIKERVKTPISNKLILIRNNNSHNIENIEDLKDKDCKIAIGDIKTVPAGEYAKETLENKNIWNNVKDKTIQCKNVSAVKTYVENGEVDYGFVYKSDSINIKNSVQVLEVSDNLHKKIIYSIAPIEQYRDKEECIKLIDYITSSKSKEILQKYGFEIMG